MSNTKKDPIGPPLELPGGRPENLSPSRLLFDPGNLRLLERGREMMDTPVDQIGQPALQSKIEESLNSAETFDVKGLAESIKNNGFLRHDRLIVASFDGENYLVLEGNRRLAAVRYVKANYDEAEFSASIKESLKLLPCHILDGLPIWDLTLGAKAREEAISRLKRYRKAAAIYIGLRHLMGAKDWDSASRYEFQAQLILQDKWTLNQVAARFGRKLGVVRRDLQAQVLYNNFLNWEKKQQQEHKIIYNAFNEAVRSKSILKWLGWDENKHEIANKKREASFFCYVSSRFSQIGKDSQGDEDEDPKPSVEKAVRHLKTMLDLEDPDIEEALTESEFKSAEVLYENRKEGTFSKRVKGYIRGLRGATVADLRTGAKENKAALEELLEEAKSVLAQIAGFLHKK